MKTEFLRAGVRVSDFLLDTLYVAWDFPRLHSVRFPPLLDPSYVKGLDFGSQSSFISKMVEYFRLLRPCLHHSDLCEHQMVVLTRLNINT